jgi:hypothetical protein
MHAIWSFTKKSKFSNYNHLQLGFNYHMIPESYYREGPGALLLHCKFSPSFFSLEFEHNKDIIVIINYQTIP